MKKKTDLLFVADPWDTLDHQRDSTLHLAKVAAEKYGARSYWCVPRSVHFEDGALAARLEGEVADGALKGRPDETRRLDSFHSIHWRADPPVDLAQMRLWCLFAATSRNVRLVNPARVLLEWNEKFGPLLFTEWSIPCLVSDDERVWESFYGARRAAGTRVIAKPSGDASSRGVEILPDRWSEASQRLRAIRENHGPWLVLQEFAPEARSLGETRAFILDGEIHGAISKKPHPKHEIMNLDAPENERPQLSLGEPSATQRKRALAIARALAADGGYLATIDFIGDRVLEINVTSPGLIQWLDAHSSGKDGVAAAYWKGLFG
jgi:glutathione synthase